MIMRIPVWGKIDLCFSTVQRSLKNKGLKLYSPIFKQSSLSLKEVMI